VPFDPSPFFESPLLEPEYVTPLGALYGDDCLNVLGRMKSETVDTVFADPPFNLGKEYRKGTNDRLKKDHYVQWCKEWIGECTRVLKPGGSIFLYNLPKWNIVFGSYLNELGLDFRHWIAVELNLLLPIPKRLYPAHYSLLYYSKGSPKTFKRIRTPIITCRHCGKEVKDYGGYRNKMNPDGVTLKDIWTDVPPVRHGKFKHEGRKGVNTISTKITDRVVNMSTLPGDVVLDPFGGSGTTFVSCERLNRRWIGIEIDYCQEIVDRLESDDIKPHKNGDWVQP
jgi:site-specific DNA-methyltransferase (adenine-specific)